MDTFGSDSIFVKNVYTWGKSSAVIYKQINKIQFVSFFVNRRQSLDRFRIYLKVAVCILTHPNLNADFELTSPPYTGNMIVLELGCSCSCQK